MEHLIYLVCHKSGHIVLATNSETTAKQDVEKLNTCFGTKRMYFVKAINFIYGK